MASIRHQGRLLAGNRVIPFFHRGMSERPIGTKLFALVIAENKANIDSLVSDITTMKTKPRINFFPTIR